MPTKALKMSHRSFESTLNQLRRKELIPGIMYGQSLKESIPVQIPLKTLQRIITNTSNSTLFTIHLDDTPYDCVLRHYQPDHLHSQILHFDLQYVKPGEVLKMQIPVSYEGTEMFRAQKLVLEKAIAKLPVVGPIDVLPQSFSVNLSSAQKGHKVLAGHIVLPEGTELLLHPDTIIATIQ
ncbi:MAG: 50S ribosomal protein L25 [Cellulosilyticaceae bacterium]